VVLIVVGVLAAACCGGLWFIGQKSQQAAKQFEELTASAERLAVRVQTDWGPGATLTVEDDPSDPDSALMIVIFGVDEEDLSPERVTELQDRAWKIYCEEFAESGGWAGKVAVGRTVGPETVEGWRQNIVTTEELAQRTGIAAPPLIEILQWVEDL
jgi:hypothetical protein